MQADFGGGSFGGRVVADASRLRVFFVHSQASCLSVTRPPRASDDVQVIICLKMSVAIESFRSDFLI